MLESDGALTETIIHFCEGIFYHYLQMDVVRMKLSFSLLKASQVLLGLKYFEETFALLLPEKWGLFCVCRMLHLKLGILYKI